MDNHRSEASHLTSRGSSRLKVALIIVLGIMTLEIIGGILSNSLALLSDAGHMLVDALALGLSLFAITIARSPASLARAAAYSFITPSCIYTVLALILITSSTIAGTSSERR